MDTLKGASVSHVEPGSIIVAGGWRGYNALDMHDYHMAVYHNKHYVDIDLKYSFRLEEYFCLI